MPARITTLLHRLLLTVMLLVLAGCPDPDGVTNGSGTTITGPTVITDGPDLGAAQPLSGPRIVYPRHTVMVSELVETVPILLSSKPGSIVMAQVDGETLAETTLGEMPPGAVQRLDVPIFEGLEQLEIVDGNQQSLGSVTLQWLPAEQFADIFLQQAPGAPAEEEAEALPKEAVDFWKPTFRFPHMFYHEDDWTPFLRPPIFEWACPLDVDVHRPISQDPTEPFVSEASDYSHGAYTLRNDDADWHIGNDVASDTLPIAAVATDLDQTGNARENDLIRIDAFNPFQLQNVYLFAFPINAERDRRLTRAVGTVNKRQANADELAVFDDATKTVAGQMFPIPIAGRSKSLWVEAKLGGRYRFVIGIVPPGTQPPRVKYDRATGATTPQLFCDQQATATAVVVDIYQQARGDNNDRERRLTAFDVYWGARPHFAAKLWPPAGQYQWAAPYRLGAQLHNVPGTAVTGVVAHMLRDRGELPPAGSNAAQRRLFGDANADAESKSEAEVSRGRNPDRNYYTVSANGAAGNGNKETVHGGLLVQNPQRAVGAPLPGQQPNVMNDDDNRYPHRISLAYTVDGETLVRPEPLAIILPRINFGSVPTALNSNSNGTGGQQSVSSSVQYQIIDQFDRRITAASVSQYLTFYGAGLKAWEALGANRNAVEGNITINGNTLAGHPDLMRVRRGNNAPLLIRTAQRAQARVHANRMTEGRFDDTLTFNTDALNGERDWGIWTGAINAGAKAARLRDAQRRNQVYVSNQANAIMAEEIADGVRSQQHPLFQIPQDVILQLRTGNIRYDLAVLHNNRLQVFVPHYFNGPRPTSRLLPFQYRLEFQRGAEVSVLVPATHRRP